MVEEVKDCSLGDSKDEDDLCKTAPTSEPWDDSESDDEEQVKKLTSVGLDCLYPIRVQS